MELRKWTYDDISNIAKYANNKKIADNLRDIFPHPYNKENAKQFIDFCLNTSERESINRAIIYDGHAIGSVSLTFGKDVSSKCAELGYWIAEEYWNKGITTEAVKEICRIAFEICDIVRVYATPYAYNKASCRVLEKCGFELEGVLKKSIIKNGQIFDSIMYGLTR